MKLRQQRGGLAESMATTIEVDATLPALFEAMRPIVAEWGVDLKPESIHVEPYGGMDKRIGWDTHIVTIDGYGVYGFSDCQLGETR